MPLVISPRFTEPRPVQAAYGDRQSLFQSESLLFDLLDDGHVAVDDEVEDAVEDVIHAMGQKTRRGL